jgi:ABC-type polysaccharide/polyol phosphate transport system ATPase subunit
MSDIAISIDRVGRMFKRYRHPRYRLMEALGLRLPKNAYDEFWALRDISFTVRRGERVGLIGRNGAGKSTLLNIVYGRLRPTLGSVRVQGQIQALMELGTGFHPEFTGRQNVLSSLAYQGISGAKALALLDEIIDFSELDDFIDQPIKTYSAGMYARLAFSTATAFEPDVLIIDEVLGAGDAYFAAKCTERMRRLTLEMGATLLFVSHDLASVERLCERAIWIERGQIHMSGTAREVRKSYHASILEQEEARLRTRTSIAVSRMRRDAKDPGTDNFVQVRLVTEVARLPQGSHPIRRLSLTTPDGLRLEVKPGSPMDNDYGYDAYLFVDPEYALWSPPKMDAGEMVRCVENTGGKYLHAQAFFKVPVVHRDRPLALEIEHAAGTTERLAVEIYDSREPAGYKRLGLLSARENQGWRVDYFSIVLNMLAAQPIGSHAAAMTAIAVESAELDQREARHGAVDTKHAHPNHNCDAAATAIVEDAGGEPDRGEQHDSDADAEHAQPIDDRDAVVTAVAAKDGGNEPDPGETQHAERNAEPKPPIKKGTRASYQDKWTTSEAEFVEIVPWHRIDSRPQFVFTLGEPVTFRVVVDVRTELSALWLAASFYDQFGSRVFLTVQEFSRGAPPGRHEISLTLDRPNLRQGEYVATFELLPEFDFNWQGLGRIPYLCLWDRCVFFKVDEGYRGVIELGLVDVAASATSPTLANAQPVGLKRRDSRIDPPPPIVVGGRRS